MGVVWGKISANVHEDKRQLSHLNAPEFTTNGRRKRKEKKKGEKAFNVSNQRQMF